MYPDSIDLPIPIDTYLKKYLVSKYGEVHRVTRDSWLGRYVIETLGRKYKREKQGTKKKDFYHLSIPNSVIKEDGFFYSQKKSKAFADMIEEIFYNDLYSYIEVSIGNELKFVNDKSKNFNKQNVYKAIEQFLGFYDISEGELRLDSVYRRYSRYKISDKDDIEKKQTA